MKSARVAGWIALAFAATGAQAQTRAADDTTALEITKNLRHFCDVATVTRKNEAYQPYIITVYRGEELRRRGIRTLGEALELVPGVDMATDLADMRMPIIRGSNPFAFGQIRLLIDGMQANDTFTDAFSGYLYMPVELIKRIEIVRGPGSRTDGINAYAGTISVITYAEDLGEERRAFFTGVGSYEEVNGGFVYGTSLSGVRVHVDGYVRRDEKTLRAGPDALATGAYNYPWLGIDNTSLAQTGDAPLQTDVWSLGVQVDSGAWTFKVRGNGYRHGSAYGINGMLPKRDDHIEIPSCLAEIGFDKGFGDVQVSVKAGARFDSFYSDARLAPPGLEIPSPLDPHHLVTVFPDGFSGIHEARQRNFYHSLYFKYDGFEGHRVTAGYRLDREETYHVRTVTTDRITGVGMTDYSDTLPFLDPDAKRDKAMLSLQDKMEVGTKIGLLYGVNIEKTTRSSLQIDPRVSLVYQADTFHIFKAIYSHSHRNPSWQEMYTLNNSARVGNPDLEPEQVDAFEVAAIRKLNASDFVRLVMFYLYNQKQIDRNNLRHRYENAHSSRLYGLEAEMQIRPTVHDRLYGAYSFVTGKNEEGELPPDIARHLAYFGAEHTFSPYFSLSALVRYIGRKERMDGDPRPAVDPFVSADASVRIDHRPSGFSFVGGVRNLADAKGSYPSEPNTYVDDYPREGRTFFLQVQKVF